MYGREEEKQRMAPFQKAANRETQVVVKCRRDSDKKRQELIKQADQLQHILDELKLQYQKAPTIEEKRRRYAEYTSKRDALKQLRDVINVYNSLDSALENLLSLLSTATAFNKYWYIVYKLPANKFKRIAGNLSKYDMLLKLIEALSQDFTAEIEAWRLADKRHTEEKKKLRDIAKSNEILANGGKTNEQLQTEEDLAMEAEMNGAAIEIADLPDEADLPASDTLKS